MPKIVPSTILTGADLKIIRAILKLSNTEFSELIQRTTSDTSAILSGKKPINDAIAYHLIQLILSKSAYKAEWLRWKKIENKIDELSIMIEIAGKKND